MAARSSRWAPLSAPSSSSTFSTTKPGSASATSKSKPTTSEKTSQDFLTQFGLQPLEPLKFPTFAELASEVTPPPPSRPQTLFNIVGDPTILFSDLLDNPEKYEAGVDELLQELVHKRKRMDELSAQELQLLNRAVVAFMQAPARKPPPAPTRRAPPEPEPEAFDLDEQGAPMPAEIDLPDAPSFWWQR